MTSILRVEEVSWHAGGTTILDGASLSLAEGEFAAVLGRNGAGKSTLIDLAAGLRQPNSGCVRLAGRRLDEWSAGERARMLAHLPQLVSGNPATTAGALVLMGRYASADGWFDSDGDRALAEAAMRRCDCIAFRDRPLATLSGGERQRVLLAACLAQQPRLLLLDEPSTFLDVDQQVRCFEILRAAVDAGAACVAVTHDINLALRFCDRLLVIARGTVACALTVDQALADSRWLHELSGRLALERGASGVWVQYR